MKWLKDAYQKFLWFIGFPKGLTISECLATQKARLGPGWWAFPVLTIIVALATLAFLVWLTYHIVTFKIRQR